MAHYCAKIKLSLKKTRDLIQTLEKDGHIFSISTGRMYRSAREVGFQVSSSGHVIASNGSYAAIRDEQLLKTTLEEKAIRSTYDIMSDFDLPLFFSSLPIHFSIQKNHLLSSKILLIKVA